ncbi:MAG: PepSY-like domain-containing protein [Ignavibacteriales bacterium]|nr:PepSY-like domain-containing protein [Ignavibacteriales bacterium]
MNKTSRLHFAIVALMAFVFVAGMTCVSAQEKKLKPKQLPAAVQAAFQKAYPAAKIKGASSEVENGKTIYEVESVDGTINRDLLYSEDGSVLEIEETIALKALPDEVSKALKAETGKGKVQKAEKLTKGGTIQYEFVISSGKNTREVVIDPSGKIVKTTKMKSKNKEEEEKD